MAISAVQLLQVANAIRCVQANLQNDSTPQAVCDAIIGDGEANKHLADFVGHADELREACGAVLTRLRGGANITLDQLIQDLETEAKPSPPEDEQAPDGAKVEAARKAIVNILMDTFPELGYKIGKLKGGGYVCDLLDWLSKNETAWVLSLAEVLEEQEDESKQAAIIIRAFNQVAGEDTVPDGLKPIAKTLAGVVSSELKSIAGEHAPGDADEAGGEEEGAGGATGEGMTKGKWGAAIASAAAFVIGLFTFGRGFGKILTLLGAVGGVVTALWCGGWNYISGIWKEHGEEIMEHAKGFADAAMKGGDGGGGPTDAEAAEAL